MVAQLETTTMVRRVAFATSANLVGGLLVGVLIGFVIFESLPGHMYDVSRISISAIPALIGIFAGGARWGRDIALLTGAPDHTRRGAWAGALGYGLTVIGVGTILSVLEVAIVINGQGPQWPIHTIFTLLFVPGAALIAGGSTLAIGISLEQARVTLLPAMLVAGAAGIAFLAANRVMHVMGWVVGAPGAAESFTMVTVMFAGILAAALAGGAMLGLLLAWRE
jgi:hypothetical protein